MPSLDAVSQDRCSLCLICFLSGGADCSGLGTFPKTYRVEPLSAYVRLCLQRLTLTAVRGARGELAWGAWGSSGGSEVCGVLEGPTGWLG